MGSNRPRKKKNARKKRDDDSRSLLSDVSFNSARVSKAALSRATNANKAKNKSKLSGQRRASSADRLSSDIAQSGYLTEAARDLEIGTGPLAYKYPASTNAFEEPNAASDSYTKSHLSSAHALVPDSNSSLVSSSVASIDGSDEEPRGENIEHSEDSDEGFIAFDDINDTDPSINTKLLERFDAFEEERDTPSQSKQQSPNLASVEHFPEWPAPWHDGSSVSSKTNSVDFVTHLNHEIGEYARFVAPSKSEIDQRSGLVRRVKWLIGRLWPKAQALPFGSYAMGIYLPAADVDIVVISPDRSLGIKKRDLFVLGDRIRKAGWSQTVQVIGHARVPIIKFIDNATGLDVDISFEQIGGIHAVETVSSWVQEDPILCVLTLIVKHFLRRRKLNEPVNGGLGGYATICLVRALLRGHPLLKSGEILSTDNAGILLMEFFELYGKQFDYVRYAVKMTGDGATFLKRLKPTFNSPLAIQDPNDSDNNIARASHNLPAIRREFAHAADMLRRLCVDYTDMDPAARASVSVLAPLLKLTKTDKLTQRTNSGNATILKNNDAGKFPVVSPILSKLNSDDPASGAKMTQRPQRSYKTRTPRSLEDRMGLGANNSRSNAGPADTNGNKQALKGPRSPRSPKGPNGAGRKRPLYDPFEPGSSSSSFSSPEHVTTAKKRKSRRRSSSSSGEGDGDMDSRTKATTVAKRDYWKAKGIEPALVSEP